MLYQLSYLPGLTSYRRQDKSNYSANPRFVKGRFPKKYYFLKKVRARPAATKRKSAAERAFSAFFAESPARPPFFSPFRFKPGLEFGVRRRFRSTDLRETTANDFADFRQPLGAKRFVAQNNLFEVAAFKRLSAGQSEHNRLPKVLQRVAVNVQLDVARGVRRGKNLHRFVGQPLPRAVRREAVSEAVAQNAVDPTLQNRGGAAPPVRVREDQSDRLLDRLDSRLNIGGRLFDRLVHLGERRRRIEIFGVKVADDRRVPLGDKRVGGGLNDRAVKTFLGFRARDDDKNLIRRHSSLFFVSIFKTLDASKRSIFRDAAGDFRRSSVAPPL